VEQNYSIDEILMAVNEIQNKKKEKKIESKKIEPAQIDYSAVPRNTLKLIEEAEKLKY
jgi:hypothetical protein